MTAFSFTLYDLIRILDKSEKTTNGNKVFRTTLIACAHSAVKNKNSDFSAQYARVRAHRGKKRAIVAVARSMLMAIYHMLSEKTGFHDLGAGYYNQFNKERKANSMIKKLRQHRIMGQKIHRSPKHPLCGVALKENR